MYLSTRIANQKLGFDSNFNACVSVEATRAPRSAAIDGACVFLFQPGLLCCLLRFNWEFLVLHSSHHFLCNMSGHTHTHSCERGLVKPHDRCVDEVSVGVSDNLVVKETMLYAAPDMKRYGTGLKTT